MPGPGILKFNPRARIIRTVGDHLISGPEAAVIELVKNAHDADASFVRVRFEPPLHSGDGRIVVEDDGHGMSLEDIQQKWMEPATSDKVERSKSPGGRSLLGSKGIGRFAAAKLGRELELTTTAIADHTKSARQTTRVYGIDWDVFDTTKYLADISFPFEELAPKPHVGTILVISKLRSRWTEDSVTRLHHEMRRLISPIAESEDTDFRIYLDLSACSPVSCGFNGSQIVNGALPSQDILADPYRVRPFPILKSCDYEVEGTFDAEGGFDGTLAIHRGGLKPQPIKLKIPFRPDIDESPCGTVLVHLFIFDRDETALSQMASRAGFGAISARDARAILDSVAGIAIYRDQFRIRPYGDNDNDWLTLDKRRVQNPSTCIGHNQVSGVLLVDKDSRSGLIERSSREGLEDNGSLRRLKRQIIELLAREVEPRRVKFREDAGLGRQRKDGFSDAYKVAQLRKLASFVSKLPEPARSEGNEAVEEAAKRITGHLDSLGERLALLEARVTLGLIIGEVLHEGRNPVYFIQTETARFAKWWETICADTVEAEKRRRDVPRIIRGLLNSSDQLRSLFSALEPLSSARRGRASLYNPNQIVIDTFHLFESRAKAAGISLEHKSATDVPDVFGYKDDLATALTNIIDNSLFWLSYDGTKKATIHVDVKSGKDACVIDVIDNGPGIPAEFRDHVFDVGFTTKTNGTGLGLSIAREAVKRSDGAIEVLDTTKGTAFRISIPVKG